MSGVEGPSGDGPSGGPGGSPSPGQGSPSGPRVPLKTILQDFLAHVEDLESRRFINPDTDDAYEKEFQSLKLFSDQIKCQAEFSCSEGERDVNRKKNRYKDILPFDCTRVALSEYPGVTGSDYINANFIKGASGSNAYIACQGPLPHTVNDFWRMVVECEVQVIVMACNEQEAGKHKCEKYWTDSSDGTTSTASGDPVAEQTFGKYSVSLLKSREICPDFLVRTMRLRWRNGDSVAGTPGTGDDSDGGGDWDEERTVCQFHYSAWPDHGIPLQVKPLLEMVRLIRDCQASETLPVLVHCSAGCGRTGTICAIDFIWGLLRTGKLSSDFSLYELVKDMRRQRIAMVQTVDQYVLVHRAVKELFLEQLRVIDAHPYENVDDDGRPLCGQAKTDEHVVPDYETIFVNNPDAVRPLREGSSESSSAQPINSTEIDKILTNRMKQYSRSSSRKGKGEEGAGGASVAPPPKQGRTANLDPDVVDTRDIVIPPPSASDPAVEPVLRSKPEPTLFEPPGHAHTPDKENVERCNSSSQRFKKGNLRLTQTKDGDWKLEELEDTVSAINNLEVGGESKAQASQPLNKPSSRSKSSKGSRKDGDSPPKSTELLRKPSIKKIRAFFNKDKDASSSSSSSVENSPKQSSSNNNNNNNNSEDRDVVSAIAKLPKFEPGVTMPSPPNMTSSKSVPGSLDRKSAERDHHSAAVAAGTADDSRLKPDPASSSKPSLPVKRSKSMKTGLSSTSTPYNQATTSSQSVIQQQLGYFPGSPGGGNESSLYGQSNPLPKPKRSIPSSSQHDPSQQDLNSQVMAGFDAAEREGQRLMVEAQSPYSSPNSSHKSSSYNRYTDKSPGSSYNKYDKSPSGAGSYKSPGGSYNRYDHSPGGGSGMSPSRSQHQVPSSSNANSQGGQRTNKPLEASDTRNFARQQQHSSSSRLEGLVHDYANVAISSKPEAKSSSYVDSVVMEAQRKVSEAVVTSAMRERRNSFREAVHHGGGGGNSNPDGKGSSPHYVNIQCGPVNPSLSPEQPSDAKGYQTQQQPVQYFDVSKDATNKPLHPPPNTVQGYEPVNFKDGRALQSVSLVSDAVSSNSRLGGGAEVPGRSSYNNGSVGQTSSFFSAEGGGHPPARKQNSNSSAASSGGRSGPPPPYKQPPNIHPGNAAKGYEEGGVSNHRQNNDGMSHYQPPPPPPPQLRNNSRPSPSTTPRQHQGPLMQPPTSTGYHSSGHHYQNVPSGSIYANTGHLLPSKAFARPVPNATNDDLALTYYQQNQARNMALAGPGKPPGQGQANPSRQPRLNSSYHEGQVTMRPNHGGQGSGYKSSGSNRFSYGDFGHVGTNGSNTGDPLNAGGGVSGLTVKSLPPRGGGLSVSKADPSSSSLHSSPASTSSPGSGESNPPPPPVINRQVPPPLGRGAPGSMSTGDLIPTTTQGHHQVGGGGGGGVDLDSVAAAMGGGGGSSSGPLNRGHNPQGGYHPPHHPPSTSLSVSMSALASIAGGGGSSTGSGGGGGSTTTKGPPQFGKAIAGVISGAAANLRSKFTNLGGNSPDGFNRGHGALHHHNSPPPPLGSSAASQGSGLQGPLAGVKGGHLQHEVAPSELPATVPGASSVTHHHQGAAFSNQQQQYINNTQHNTNPSSYLYSYPNRPESRPIGPRDPPQIFNQQLRKQEYL